MSYATAGDVQRRMVKPLSDDQMDVCAALLDDAGVLIDAIAPNASDSKYAAAGPNSAVFQRPDSSSSLHAMRNAS